MPTTPPTGPGGDDDARPKPGPLTPAPGKRAAITAVAVLGRVPGVRPTAPSRGRLLPGQRPARGLRSCRAATGGAQALAQVRDVAAEHARLVAPGATVTGPPQPGAVPDRRLH